jgi:CheY-like chemotaxis protein
MKVLIAEDNDVTAEIIVWNLGKHGLQTLVVADGGAALEALEAHADVELLITDLMMPGLDGLALLEEVKRRCYLREIPVIVVSTRAEERVVARIAALGCRRFVVKPFNGLELLEIVDQALEQQPPILRPRHVVLSSRGIDAQTYGRLLVRLAEGAAAALRQLAETQGREDDALPAFPHLAEAAILLGAERLTRFFARLTADASADRPPAAALRRWLERELLVLCRALDAGAPAPVTEQREDPAGGGDAPPTSSARPLRVRPHKWWMLSGSRGGTPPARP